MDKASTGERTCTMVLSHHNIVILILEGVIPLLIRGNMSTPPLLNGPQPAYNNVPIEPQNYAPSRFVISNVTLGETTTVTTTEDVNYVIGSLCRLIIPKGYGCTQLNEVKGYVLSIPSSNQVELSIYSSGGNPFIAASLRQEPQILAIGDVNTGTVNPNRTNITTYIPGSFINISPNP